MSTMTDTTQKKEKRSSSKELLFIKQVAKYFMDFLETDFHKRRIPKRNIKLRSAENLLIGINLSKYPSFNQINWKAINKSFDKSVLRKIGKGVHKANIPQNLLDLISLQVKRISDKQIKKMVKDISKEIENASVLYKKEFNKALMVSIDEASKIIKKELVLPFISNVEKSLEQMDLGDENTIYLMEEELTSVFIKSLENKMSEVLKMLITDETVSIGKEITMVMNLEDARKTIAGFFENFKVTDLFSEMYEMERNRNILDKQEFYLYFFDITFNRVKYPIFYIPFSIERSGEGFDVNFDAQVYINKKALEYVVQEYNNEKGKRGSLKSISERIIYLAQQKENFSILIKNIVDEIVDFFELDSEIDLLNSDAQLSKSFLVRVSNSSYISLFDKSDEALVNDYEEIIQLLDEGDDVIAEAFNKLIGDFIRKDPQSFIDEVQDEWEESGTSDKLVFRTPIPLNSEQRQILMSAKKDGCKYITVEGPPGTGKSHTITALAFDAILKNQNILVLSDKKEALDVVENKITETMNKVRLDKNFQNPILRLGKTGNTYSQILSTTSIENIRTNYKAVRKDYKQLEENVEKTVNTLKEDLEAESISYQDVNIDEIYDFTNLENYFKESGVIVELDEFLDRPDSAVELEEMRKMIIKIRDEYFDQKNDNKYLNLLGTSPDDYKDVSALYGFFTFINSLLEVISKLDSVYKDQLKLLDNFPSFSDKDFESLKLELSKYAECKHRLFGYLFAKKKLESLDLEFKKIFPESRFEIPHQQLAELKEISDMFTYLQDLRKELDNKFLKDTDFLKFIHASLINRENIDHLKKFTELKEDIEYMKSSMEKYPKSFDKLKIKLNKLETLKNNPLLKISDSDFDKLLKYIVLKQKLNKQFTNIPFVNYLNQKKVIEDLVTTQMTYLMDKSVTNFYDNNRATAKTLREIIKSKRRFPKREFAKLKEAFPCILAGIRDYAEYIPLEPEIFDLLIIDEASQVSIAQAFPALLRAKKVIILGDRKQFSNVKASQARTETNKEYLNSLRKVFKKHISEESSKIVRLEKFNIKTSILEFLEYITNFNTRLRKHFRGYEEIISYSNHFFYQDDLQVMKIRGKPIDRVLTFNFIKHDGKTELIQNTNLKEVEFIISKLQELKKNENDQSVGIITPHTNQQKLLIEKISLLPERDEYFDNMRLKIMTFDTCQGEERDIVFYSMVATKEDDRLWGVFIKDLSSVDLEEDGVIRAQRLNVGFSRAKEQINFVLSKPLDQYSGSVGEALRHYHHVLEKAKKEPQSDQVDPKSPMEKKLLHLMMQTKFYKENSEKIEIVPQFDLGKYLKQLDRTYNHPNYIVDFLVLYTDQKQKIQRVVVEYDGFEYHFKERDEVNEFNYDYYYTDDDVYRTKVLESYGYKVIRINRFNLGKDPISSLDEKLSFAAKEAPSVNGFLSGVHRTIESLQSGEMKECPRCNEIRNLEDFKDSSLITGYGRFCRFCKGLSYPSTKPSLPTSHVTPTGDVECPRCNSRMILRSGRYGQFYGCSKFPYCRGTRSSSAN
ncbi:AAA domain-containing protein [Patescibacteria group bacterium]